MFTKADQHWADSTGIGGRIKTSLIASKMMLIDSGFDSFTENILVTSLIPIYLEESWYFSPFLVHLFLDVI